LTGESSDHPQATFPEHVSRKSERRLFLRPAYGIEQLNNGQPIATPDQIGRESRRYSQPLVPALTGENGFHTLGFGELHQRSIGRKPGIQ
jgi:hypothetical protein